jgi:hypothetical protein
MKTCIAIALVVMILAADVRAAGFVHNENFTIVTPAQASQQESDRYAAALLDKAERYRREIALEWLGEELPPSVGRTIVNVTFSSGPDQGLTWAKDHPDRKYHTLYLAGSPAQDLDRLLAHEMVHVILATRYPHPNRLPTWLEEGIACRYDSDKRQAVRHRIIKWLAHTGNWSPLRQVLDGANISASDQESYAVCVTLTDMLLARGGKQTLLAFGQSGLQLGWDRALSQHYGIKDVAELQSHWQQWTTRLANELPAAETPIAQR